MNEKSNGILAFGVKSRSVETDTMMVTESFLLRDDID